MCSLSESMCNASTAFKSILTKRDDLALANKLHRSVVTIRFGHTNV